MFCDRTKGGIAFECNALGFHSHHTLLSPLGDSGIRTVVKAPNEETLFWKNVDICRRRVVS